MPASALAELTAYTLQGILEKLKGKWFWLVILIIIFFIMFILYLA